MAGLAADAVPGAFDLAAPGYDLLVGANPGYHRELRRAATALGIADSGAGRRLLDLGCGTGASTAALLSVAPRAEIIGVDASAGMLLRAARKPWPDNVSFVHARAEGLTTLGPFDGIFAAYLIRNLADPDPVLATIHGLLKPRARFVAHEYSVRDSPVAGAIWTAVCWTVIIPAGVVVTRSPKLYTYLWRSVVSFDGVRALRDRLRRNGFTDVRALPACGWQRGILHTFVGQA
ncbi:ubiquinone biosynthesis methyltransferase UbiE [Saccharothrix sp. ALI-22-I]|nr:class I SAM-dependent methyltransferase [Saccharothrix sp. ALI-22-I]ONI80840.1 ubiquinone biosynthesis methyltransferase UbiE [Saccharothrix sp. ALI-22-I]